MANNRLLSFPSDLNTDNNPSGFIKFVAMRWTVTNKRDLNVENKSDIIDTIVLPLPNSGLTDELTVSWQEESGLGADGILGALKHAGLSAIKNIVGGIGTKISHRQGKVLNDLAAATFENADFRQNSFEWALIPKNINDAKTLGLIIKSFQRNSLPSQQSDNILRFPAFWEVSIYAPTNKELFRYKLAVCTSASSNYMPESLEAFHHDGKPVKTALSVAFKEMYRPSAEDYED